MEKNWIELDRGCEGKSVMEALHEQGVYLSGNCGSNGTCGKCQIRICGEAPAPSEPDQKLLSGESLEKGVRLACKTKAAPGMRIVMVTPDESKMTVESSFWLPGGIRAGKASSGEERTGDFGSASAVPGELGSAVPGEPASAVPGEFAAAVDIGTTTIAMSAVETGTGRIVKTVTGVNHQRAFGADVISRMEASNRGKGEQLRQAVASDLGELRKRLGLRENVKMLISGNTTMEHLLQGMPCTTLGVAPYTPVDLSLHEYGNMTILPGISTFVGADIVSGIVACGMDEGEEICLLVDLGTNGEMAIGNRDRILSASTAAGPAFEGGNISCGIAGIPGAVCSVEIRDRKARSRTIGGEPAVGICGTGVIEVVYELLKEGLIDETGLLDEEYFDSGFPVAEGVVFTEKDIREVQLAKSAVRAGIEVLIDSYGTDFSHIGKLYLAGGFGQKIDLIKAAGIGLLPGELLERTYPVGNTSLAGAVMAAHDPAVLDRMVKVARTAEETALAENPQFSDLYMDNMFFPEQE